MIQIGEVEDDAAASGNEWLDHVFELGRGVAHQPAVTLDYGYFVSRFIVCSFFDFARKRIRWRHVPGPRIQSRGIVPPTEARYKLRFWQRDFLGAGLRGK